MDLVLHSNAILSAGELCELLKSAEEEHQSLMEAASIKKHSRKSSTRKGIGRKTVLPRGKGNQEREGGSRRPDGRQGRVEGKGEGES